MHARWIMALLLASAAACAVHAAQPQAFPSRPIRMIIPWPPGGGTDVIGRILCARLAESLGQQVVVDNRGGASTIIGMDILAKSIPDGHTMGFATSNLAINPALFGKLPFDVRRDFMPVTLAVRGLYSIVVHPSVGARNLGELIATAKAQPERMNAALAGTGTPPHLGLAQFNAMTGSKLAGINYKGAGPAIAAVVGGETQLMFVSYPTAQPHIQSGRLRAIAVTSAQRSAAAPDLPTAIESGLPGFVLEEWYGIVAPARTAREPIARVEAEIRRALAQGETRNRMAALGADVVASTPAEFGAFIANELGRWDTLVKAAGIKPD